MTTPCRDDPLTRKSEECSESANAEKYPDLAKTKAISLESGSTRQRNAAGIENTDTILSEVQAGVEVALKYTSDWLEYTKSLADYIERRCNLESDFSKGIVKLASSTCNSISSNVYMTSQSLCVEALKGEISANENVGKVCELMMSGKVLQPLINRRFEHRKLYKRLKDQWTRSQREMNAAIHDLNKAKSLYAQRHNDYERAMDSLQKVTSGGESFTQSLTELVLSKSSDGRTEKKIKQKNDAMHRVTEAEMMYKSQLYKVNSCRIGHDKTEKEILMSLRHVITDSDLVLKTVLGEYFGMLNKIATPTPVHLQHIQDGCATLTPGSHYVAYVNKLDLPRKRPMKVFTFEPLGNVSAQELNVIKTNRASTLDARLGRSADDINISDDGDVRAVRDGFLMSRSVDSSPSRSPPISSQKQSRSFDAINTEPIKKGAISRQSNVFTPPTSPTAFSVTSNGGDRNHKFRRVRTPSRCKQCNSMSYSHNMECCKCGLSVHERCIKSLKLDCDKMTPGSWVVVPKTSYFGSRLTDQPRVPLLVRMCVSEIDRRALDVKGLYRVSGTKSRQKYLCERFEEQESELNLEEESPHDITGLLRQYLRELKEPLLTYACFQKLVELSRVNRLNLCPEVDILSAIKLELDGLPRVHYETAAYLFHHLKRVTKLSQENMMTATNLGVVFGPTLLRSKEEEPTTEYVMDQCRIIQIMIENSEELFGEDANADMNSGLPSEELEDKTDAVNTVCSSSVDGIEKQRRGSYSVETDDNLARSSYGSSQSLPPVPLEHHPTLSLDLSYTMPRVKLSQSSMSMTEFLSLPDASNLDTRWRSAGAELMGDEVFDGGERGELGDELGGELGGDVVSPITPLTPDDINRLKRFTPARVRAYSPQTHKRFNRDLLKPQSDQADDPPVDSSLIRGCVKRASADLSSARSKYLLNDDAPSPQGVYRQLPDASPIIHTGYKHSSKRENIKVEKASSSDAALIPRPANVLGDLIEEKRDSSSGRDVDVNEGKTSSGSGNDLSELRCEAGNGSDRKASSGETNSGREVSSVETSSGREVSSVEDIHGSLRVCNTKPGGSS